MRRRRRRSTHGLALARFWAVVIIVVGAGALGLEWLGPPPPPSSRAPIAEHAPGGAFVGTPSQSVQTAVARTTPPGMVRPTAAPDPRLLEPAPGEPKKLLPRIGPGGRTSIVAYAGSFDATDPRPRIGLVIAGIGLSAAESKNVIDELPAAVTLAFSPYAPDPTALLAEARKNGHEFLISLPLEPSGYPLNSAGDESLLIEAPHGQNLRRLDWTLGRIAGYVGATGGMDGMVGDRFSAEPDLLDALERRLAARGLLYIDARPGKHDPRAVVGRTADVIVDQPAIPSVVKSNLAKLETTARLKGSALGFVGWAGPRTLQELIAWTTTLPESGFVLAPVTALVEKPAPGEGKR